MHIQISEDKEGRRPERDKRIKLNIPIGGKSEILHDDLYEENSLLGPKNKECESLVSKLKELQISFKDEEECGEDDTSSSEDEDEKKELEQQLTAKSPDRPNDQKKKLERNNIKPYVIATRSGKLQSGGDVTANPIDNLTSYGNIYQIPTPVAEFVPDSNNDNGFGINQFYTNTLDDHSRELLNGVLDFLVSNSEIKNSSNINQNLLFLKDTEAPLYSPDSTYGTLSPVSFPPASPHTSEFSPNPTNDKIRVSESDSTSASDIELGSSCEVPLGYPDPKNIIFCLQSRTMQNTFNIQSQQTIMKNPGSSQFKKSVERPLEPDTKIVVNEFGLNTPAKKRLEKKMKDKIFDIQWSAAIEEAKTLLINRERVNNTDEEELKIRKDVLRNQLIDLIIKGPEHEKYFFERLYSRIKLYRRSHFDILTGKNMNGYTPLLAAAIFQKDCPIIARLIADENGFGKLDNEENTILHYLAKKGDSHVNVMSELLHSKKFNVNQKNIGCKTALHYAIICNQKESCLACIKQLIAHGADLKIKDFCGKTALHLAIEQPIIDSRLLRALLQSDFSRGAIDIMDNENNTPLHLAADRNDLELDLQKDIIRKLVNSNAKHDIRNKSQKTPFMLVADERKEEIRRIFQGKL